MMLNRAGPGMGRFAVLMAAGGLWMWGLGCVGQIQRELSVLLAGEVEPLLIRDSFLVDLLGPNVIRALFG